MSTKRSSRVCSSAIVAGWRVGRAAMPSGSVGSVRPCRRWSGGWVACSSGRCRGGEFGLEAVAAAVPPERRVVNTMPLSVNVDAGAPCLLDGVRKVSTTIGAGDAQVGGDGQGVAGVIVEPGQDLDVGDVGEAVVGEVGLPHLVGLLGFEADVGRPGPLLPVGVTRPWRRRVRSIVGSRHRSGGGVRGASGSCRRRRPDPGHEASAELDDQLDRRCGDRRR